MPNSEGYSKLAHLALFKTSVKIATGQRDRTQIIVPRGR